MPWSKIPKMTKLRPNRWTKCANCVVWQADCLSTECLGFCYKFDPNGRTRAEISDWMRSGGDVGADERRLARIEQKELREEAEWQMIRDFREAEGRWPTEDEMLEINRKVRGPKVQPRWLNPADIDPEAIFGNANVQIY